VVNDYGGGASAAKPGSADVAEAVVAEIAALGGEAVADAHDNEFYGYEWQTDRFGRQLDKPTDFNNHLIDAARYGAMMRLSVKAENKGKYNISIR
jgi:phage terminase large subunit